MATASIPIAPGLRLRHLVRRWFFPAMALAMIATSLAGFVPSMAHPLGRHAPVSGLVAAHGIVFFAWLLLFLVQSGLVATGYKRLHRSLGLASLSILALMIPLAYGVTIAMVRRGFDLSGDLHVAGDAAYEAVFPLSNLLIFSVLAIAAVAYRRRPELHKRLMLFANIELMPAPLTHLIGHTPSLTSLPGAIVIVPISMFVLAAVGRDLLDQGRVHRLTWGLAALRIVSGPLEAGPIGTSSAWHHLVSWLAP